MIKVRRIGYVALSTPTTGAGAQGAGWVLYSCGPCATGRSSAAEHIAQSGDDRLRCPLL